MNKNTVKQQHFNILSNCKRIKTGTPASSFNEIWDGRTNLYTQPFRAIDYKLMLDRTNVFLLFPAVCLFVSFLQR